MFGGFPEPRPQHQSMFGVFPNLDLNISQCLGFSRTSTSTSVSVWGFPEPRPQHQSMFGGFPEPRPQHQSMFGGSPNLDLNISQCLGVSRTSTSTSVNVWGFPEPRPQHQSMFGGFPNLDLNISQCLGVSRTSTSTSVNVWEFSLVIKGSAGEDSNFLEYGILFPTLFGIR